jgi:hypothetical protein
VCAGPTSIHTHGVEHPADRSSASAEGTNDRRRSKQEMIALRGAFSKVLDAARRADDLGVGHE